MRSFDPTFEPKEVVGVRRLEVITGVGGRRAWSHEDKGRIVAESFAPGANVAAVARRYGLRAQQVYAWRRLARGGALALPAEEPLGFVPVVAAPSQPIPSVAAAPRPAEPRPMSGITVMRKKASRDCGTGRVRAGSRLWMGRRRGV